MKKKILKLDVDQHFGNRLVRLCSPAARGFLIDLRALCVPSGELVANGVPLTVKQIASLTGSTVAEVNSWFKELAAADAYETGEDRLFFADMVKDAKFKSGAKEAGARGAAAKKAKPAVEMIPVVKVGHGKPAEVIGHVEQGFFPERPSTPKAPAKKPALWYKSDAGWWRAGQAQGISKGQNETMDDFKLRVSMRLSEGPHLDYVPTHVAKKVRAEIDKYKAKPKE